MTTTFTIDVDDQDQVDALTKSLVEALYAVGSLESAHRGIHPETVRLALLRML
jgi:hypothetical protein